MSDKSRIEWTDASWSPLTGCTKISPGCDHCYAEALSLRLQKMGQQKYRNGFDLTLHPDTLTIPLRWKRPRQVFVNSMSDLFHEDVPLTFIAQIWAVMAQCPQHTFQILTKRPQRMEYILNRNDTFASEYADAIGRDISSAEWPKLEWPLPNVWLGTSIESNKYVFRAEYLRDAPAAVHFISAEPLLGLLDMLEVAGLDWVIAGGESGPHARPVDPEWIRCLRDACNAWDVAFFFKQWGGRTPKAGGRELDGRTWDEYPMARAEGAR